MKLVVSDGHKGIQKAVDKSFLGASWQMCHVHFIRAVLRNVAKKNHKEIADKIKTALENETEMQQLHLDLESRGYSKSGVPLSISNSVYGITGRSPEIIGEE